MVVQLSFEPGAVDEPEGSDSEPTGQAAADAPRPFVITMDYRDRVSYALAHNKVPTITSITVRNALGGASGALTIDISSQWAVSATPPLKPERIVVQCPPLGDAAMIPATACRLDDVALVELEEAAPATIHVRVTTEDGTSQTEAFDFVVLARNQWNDDLLEITAAFVQPNHPGVNDVLSKASDILAKHTGSGALDGYQQLPHDPDRPGQIAQSIFEALQTFVTSYIEPPAGYDDEGQKLRPIDEVLEQHHGTCIDLACAYASCLEQAGVHPLVYLLHGHAFTGFFVAPRPEHHPSVEKSFTALINPLERGDITCVETTLIPGGATFAAAVACTSDNLTERSASCTTCTWLVEDGQPVNVRPHLRAAVDIVGCHRSGIRPIPARVVRDGQLMIVIDNGPAQPPVVERRDVTTHKLLPQTVPARVQQWKNSLLDLSYRNALLNFKPLRSGIALFPPAGSLGGIEDHLAGGGLVDVLGDDQLGEIMKEAGFRAVRDLGGEERVRAWNATQSLYGDVDTGTLPTRARNLASKARLEEQEIAVNNLHLTLGSLKWTEPGAKGAELSAPVFLVPIRMTLKRGKQVPRIAMDPGSVTTVNFCLIEALRARFGMTLSWFSEDMHDDLGLDVALGLKKLREELDELGLAARGFDVIDDAAIGILRFNKIRLWKDLDEHWEQFVTNPVVRHLVEDSGGRFVDPKNPDGEGVPAYDDTTLYNPQPADGAQTRAIVRALDDQSFVLEGPPGTGKSQTITNLLANAVAKGKKVLFVAEKQAALRVVKDRLTAVGMHPFCLDLHDKGSKPDAIKGQLQAALEIRPVTDPQHWDDAENAYASMAQTLTSYRDRLHGHGASGRSYFEAYEARATLGDGPVAAIRRGAVHVSREDIEIIRRALLETESFTTAAKPAAEHPWRLVGDHTFDDVDRVALAETIARIEVAIAAIEDTTGPWRDALELAEATEQLAAVGAAGRIVTSGDLPDAQQWRAIARDDSEGCVTSALDDVSAALTGLGSLGEGFGPEMLGRDLQPQLTHVREAAGSFAIGRKGRVRKALGDLADTAPFTDSEADAAVSTLEQLVALCTKYQSGSAVLRASAGFSALAKETITTADQIEDRRSVAADLLAVARTITVGSQGAEALLAATTSIALPAPAFVTAACELSAAIDELQARLGASEASTDRWRGERTLVASARASLPTWSLAAEDHSFLSLRRWIDLLRHLCVLDDDAFAPFRDQLLDGEIAGTDGPKAFDRALMDTTLTVVGEEQAFDVFDQVVQNRQVTHFVSALQEREQLLRTEIPRMLCAARTFQASSGAGAVSELKHELQTKKKGATRSVRNLLAKHADLILELTPCFLMSPDSVAKFLVPGKIHFDIVVFDEASQIMVSDAIGALGRANSVVVVGDSKQMPPTEAFAFGAGADDDDATSIDDVPEDADSILEECVDAGLGHEMLAWHYRSRDEVLIAFSNTHYYENRLSSFPSPLKNRSDCGIVYHRVNGQFDHGKTRTNATEADAIVAEVQRRVNDPELSRLSLGVITLNLEQRRLVYDKLLALDDEAIHALLESEDPEQELFVLNLESVQGRERDVIILGTSFSRPEGGGKMPLNFGPLIKARGERRLNVAVTRARSQVVIFSSFDPGELEGANSVGLVHLREYLELARRANADREVIDAPMTRVDADPYVQEVAEALRARGFVVDTRYGLSSFKIDLVVTVPECCDRWLVGVLLDGEAWGQRELVLDRDALPVTVLQDLMHWPAVARVWLPAWRHQREEIVEDLVSLVLRVAREDAVESAPDLSAIAGVGPPDDEPSDRPEPEAAVEAVPPVDGPTAGQEPQVLPNEHVGRARPYAKWAARVVGTPDALDPQNSTAHSLLLEIIDAEGPIGADHALKKVANAFGVSQVREQRLSGLRALLPPELTVETPFGTFLFGPSLLSASGRTPAFDWYRNSTVHDRSVQDIAPHELANLMVDLTGAAFSISAPDLAREVLSALGYGRKKVETLAYVERVAAWAVDHEYLQRDNDVLRTPTN